MIDKAEARAYLGAMGRLAQVAFALSCLAIFLFSICTSQLSAEEVQEVNPGQGGQTLDLKSLPVQGKTTVVDFYCQYCPPCLRLAPLLEELARKRPDLAIKKANIQRPEVSGHIDWQSPLARQLNLRAIPHFMIFDPKGQLAVQGREAMTQVLGWLKEAGLIKE